MPTEKPLSIEFRDGKALLHLRNRINKYGKQLASSVGKAIYEETKFVTGKEIISVKDLRKLKHPYSVNYPKNYKNPDDRLISPRSHTLYKSIRRTTTDLAGKGQTVTVWVGAKYSRYLIEGTEKMRPRNFLELAMIRAKRRLSRLEKQWLDNVARQEQTTRKDIENAKVY